MNPKTLICCECNGSFVPETDLQKLTNCCRDCLKTNPKCEPEIKGGKNARNNKL